MGSKFNDLYDNITLSGDKTNEIMRRIRALEPKRALGAKSLYVTMGASFAVIMLMVVGGSFLLNSGIINIPQQGGDDDPYLTAGAAGTENPYTIEDTPDTYKEAINRTAADAKDHMNLFLEQEAPEREYMFFGTTSVLVISTKEDGFESVANFTSSSAIAGRSRGEEINSDRLEDHFRGVWREVTEEESYEYTLVFIIENNECTHAAFMNVATDFRTAYSLTVQTADGKFTFAGIADNELTADIGGELVKGLIIGTAPVKDYEEWVYGWGSDHDEPIVTSMPSYTEFAPEFPDGYHRGVLEVDWIIPEARALIIASAEVDRMNHAKFGYLPDALITFDTLELEESEFARMYRVGGDVHYVTRGREAFGATTARETFSATTVTYEVVINAETGEIISSVIDR